MKPSISNTDNASSKSITTRPNSVVASLGNYFPFLFKDRRLSFLLFGLGGLVTTYILSSFLPSWLNPWKRRATKKPNAQDNAHNATSTSSLKENGFTFNDESRLVQLTTGKPFVFESKAQFEHVSSLVANHAKILLKEYCDEILLPKDDRSSSDNPLALAGARKNEAAKKPEKTLQTPVYISKNFNDAKKLLILIQNMGPERPGLWSRALALENFKEGSMISYIQQAIQAGYAVLILNPNNNFEAKSKEKIPFSETADKHTMYVYENLVKNHTGISEIFVLGYGSGGRCATNLLRCVKRDDLRKLEHHHDIIDPTFWKKLKAIAFVDSVHSVHNDDSDDVKEFLKRHSQNWMPSTLPVGSQVPGVMDFGCSCVSGGHEQNVRCINIVKEHIFYFFESHSSLPSQQQPPAPIPPPSDVPNSATTTTIDSVN